MRDAKVLGWSKEKGKNKRRIYEVVRFEFDFDESFAVIEDHKFLVPAVLVQSAMRLLILSRNST